MNNIKQKNISIKKALSFTALALVVATQTLAVAVIWSKGIKATY
jgi:hypothetical protein